MRIRVAILLLLSAILFSCSPLSVHEAETVTAQADSLWHEGKMYGIDEGDSATLAQAYQTLRKHAFGIPFIAPSPRERAGGEVCYHYGRLLRAKDNPAAAMQAFIDATHTRTHDYHILGRVYSNMGSICHLAGDFPLSYDMFSRSANSFLRNGDTLLYYFGMYRMAFELAEQGKKDSCLSLTRDIMDNYEDSVLWAYCNMSKAQAFLKSKEYDSVLIYSRFAESYLPFVSSITLQIAQAYYYLGNQDSATFYARSVIEQSHSLLDKNNALYILTNNDNTKDIRYIRQTAAERADVQKLIEIHHGKLSQAVQLLEQDLARKPDWKWLYAIAATILVISLCLSVYIFRKRRQYKLLSQQVDEQAMNNAVIKQQHEQLVQAYAHYKQNKVEQIEQNCTILVQAGDFPKNIHWKDYNTMCKIINDDLGKLATKLQTIYHLSEREIRLCVLVLLNMNRNQISEMLSYAKNGVGKLKYRVAKKIGTDSKNLRRTLVEIALKNTD